MVKSVNRLMRRISALNSWMEISRTRLAENSSRLTVMEFKI